MTHVYFALIGLFGAMTGSYIGVGGGVIFVPLLLLATNDMADWAKTISVFAVVVLAIVSTIKHTMNKSKINWKLAFTVAVPSILGGILTTLYVGPLIDKKLSYILYILLTLFILTLFIFREKMNLQLQQKLYILIPLGLAFGSLSGIFGIGGGVLYVPALVILFGYDIKKAGPTALVITGLSAVAVLLTHVASGHVVTGDIWYMITVGILAIPGSLIGVYLNRRSKKEFVQIAFIIMMLLIIVENIMKIFDVI